MNPALTKEKAQQLFQEHSQYIFHIALMMTRSKILAEDMTQEVFIQLFQKYHLYDSSRPIRPWLATVTVNLIRVHYRKKKWLLFMGNIPDRESRDRVEQVVLQKESDQIIWEAVARLSLKQREVITLHYYGGMTLVEVALILNIATGTCKSRLNAGLAKLRLCPLMKNMFEENNLTNEKNTLLSRQWREGQQR